MALSIKANAEDLPSIFQILGLGQPPPVDSSLAGAPPDLPDTSVSSQQSVPTKLGRLQQIIQASQGNTDSPAMTDQHSSPSTSAPATFDPSTQGASGQSVTVHTNGPHGLVQPGNINLTGRPILSNPDGTISSEKSFSIGTDKGETLLPLIVNGKELTQQQAIDHYRQTGEHMGIFDTPENADAYANQVHNRQLTPSGAPVYVYQGGKSPAAPRSLADIVGNPDPNIASLVSAAQGTPPGSVPDPSPVVSRNMSQLPDVGEGAPAVTEHQTWAQQHPGLARILKIGLSAGEGALAGSQYANVGQGFMAAHELTDPIRKKMEDATLAEKQAATEHQKVATQQMGSQVTLPNGLTVPFALAQKLYPTLITEQGKNSRGQANIDSRESIAGDKNALALRKQGLKLDANGKQVPLGRDEMSESELATLDLKQSQQDATDARAELDRNKNNPNSPAYKAAMGRLAVAQRNADTAAGRLGLAKDTFNANYFGTGPDGQALPGVPLTENDTPVGIRTANITKPTGTTRSKADQAGVVLDQGNALLKQIDANPELYGAVAGRWNEFNAGKFGNASQEVRDAYTSLKSFAALQPALHGARGIGMMHEFEDAVGNMGNDPDGLKGSIQSLLRTARDFKKAGTMKTAPGAGAHPAATHVYDPATGVIAPIKK